MKKYFFQKKFFQKIFFSEKHIFQKNQFSEKFHFYHFPIFTSLSQSHYLQCSEWNLAGKLPPNIYLLNHRHTHWPYSVGTDEHQQDEHQSHYLQCSEWNLAGKQGYWGYNTVTSRERRELPPNIYLLNHRHTHWPYSVGTEVASCVLLQSLVEERRERERGRDTRGIQHSDQQGEERRERQGY